MMTVLPCCSFSLERMVSTVAGSNDFALLGFLSGRVGNEDPASHLFSLLEPFHEDSIV